MERGGIISKRYSRCRSAKLDALWPPIPAFRYAMLTPGEGREEQVGPPPGRPCAPRFAAQPGRAQRLPRKQRFHPKPPSEIGGGKRRDAAQPGKKPPAPRTNPGPARPAQPRAPRSPRSGAAGVRTWHAEETARHRQLGCLRKVGEHGAGGGGDAALQSALGLRSLRKRRRKKVGKVLGSPGSLEAVADGAAGGGRGIGRGFWPGRGK